MVSRSPRLSASLRQRSVRERAVRKEQDAPTRTPHDSDEAAVSDGFTNRRMGFTLAERYRSLLCLLELGKNAAHTLEKMVLQGFFLTQVVVLCRTLGPTLLKKMVLQGFFRTGSGSM